MVEGISVASRGGFISCVSTFIRESNVLNASLSGTGYMGIPL